MNLFARGWEAGLDFLYPPLCVLCRERLGRGERTVCSRCWARVERWDGAITLSPGRSVRAVYAAALFDETMQGIIHNFKYRNKKSLAGPLGGMMVEALADSEPCDAVIPVPLHRARKRERGYNQSDLLAREVGARLEIPVLPKALKRTRNTRTQTGLAKEERLENVRGAFRIRDREAVAGKSLLLVDDVTTTGATLEACAETLVQAGAGKVLGLASAWAQ